MVSQLSWAHNETDLLYYGYRYYVPSTGRWLSKDPIGETGGKNLYSFSGNCGVNCIDKLGLSTVDITELINPPAGSVGLEYHWGPLLFIENQNPMPLMPDGKPMYAVTQMKHQRTVRWERRQPSCPCGIKLAYYRLQTSGEIRLSGTIYDASLVVTASGRTALGHELEHAEIDKGYDTFDQMAYAPIYGRCISEKCYDAWKNYEVAMVALGRNVTDTRQYLLEVADYPLGSNRDMYESLAVQEQAQLLSKLADVVRAAAIMSIRCGQ